MGQTHRSKDALPGGLQTTQDPAVVAAARRGDDDAYRRLVEPLRGELHAHCYRMLGSVHDAEDALQDALLRAWRGIARFEGRSSVRSWLYTIATKRLSRRDRSARQALFRLPGFVAGNVATVGLFASIFGGVFFFSQFLQTGLGLSPLEAGLGLLPWTSALFVIGPIAGVMADRIGNRPLLVGGLTLAALGIGWVALIAEPGLPYGELVVPFVVASIGGSMAMPPAANAVLGSVAQAEVGKAAGVNSMLRELGGVLGLAVLVAVFAGTGSYASPAAFVDGFAPAIGVCAALVACGAVAGAFVPARRDAGPAIASIPAPQQDRVPVR